MKKSLFFALILLLVMAQTAPAAAISEQTIFLLADDEEAYFPPPVELRFDPNAVPASFLPPTADSLRPHIATVEIDFIPAGSTNYWGYTCMTFPAQAPTAFLAAADAWETLINSSVTIHIEACWADLATGILGSSGALGYWRNFTNRPQADTFYPAALANALAGTDLRPASVCTAAGNPASRCDDMSITYNNDYINDFYYGTDGNTGGKIDFMSVVMHEIGHALGFAGSMSTTGSYPNYTGYWGLSSDGINYYPVGYDRFTYDNGGTLLISYTRGTTALGTALTDPTMTFRGAQAVKAYCGGNVPLYTPTSWQSGSSYSHFSNLMDTYDRGQNAMMTYSIGVNQVYHHPGAIMLSLLRDVGWNIPDALNAPSGLSLTQTSDTSIQLNWTDTNSSPNESGYVVERSPNGTDTWTVITTTAANATSYTDSGLTPATAYYYKIRAANGAAVYCPSNVAGFTPTGAISPPLDLAAAAVSPGRVNLSWNDLNLLIDGYWIDRSEVGEEGPWTLIATLPPFGRGYADSTVSEGTQYYYQVTAFTLDPLDASTPAAAQALTPLNAPGGLAASRAPSPGTGAVLSWIDTSALETGFMVERSLNGKSGWVTACTAAANTQTCTDTGAAPGIWYYRVQAIRNTDPANVSAWSASARLMLADHFFFSPLVVK